MVALSIPLRSISAGGLRVKMALPCSLVYGAGNSCPHLWGNDRPSYVFGFHQIPTFTLSLTDFFLPTWHSTTVFYLRCSGFKTPHLRNPCSSEASVGRSHCTMASGSLPQKTAMELHRGSSSEILVNYNTWLVPRFAIPSRHFYSYTGERGSSMAPTGAFFSFVHGEAVSPLPNTLQGGE